MSLRFPSSNLGIEPATLSEQVPENHFLDVNFEKIQIFKNYEFFQFNADQNLEII